MRSNIINSLRPAALALCAAAALLCARDARADTFTVTVVTDAPDAVPGNGVCETGAGNGVCTLRAAVMEANALAGEDVIQLPADTVQLTRAGSDATALLGDLDLKGRLTIRGVQSDTSILSAGQIDRAFHVLPQAIVTMTNFTIRDGDIGFAAGASGFGAGALVDEGAQLVLESMIVRENRAHSGGGITNFSSVWIRNSAILYNQALTQGGGIEVSQFSNSTVIENSIILGNASNEAGGGVGVRGPTTIQNSLIQGNVSPTGGGIFADHFLIVVGSRVYSNTATCCNGGGLNLNGGLIADSHIAWNSTVQFGGGVATEAHVPDPLSDATITIVRSTISNNRANQRGGGIYTGHELLYNLIDSAMVDNSAITGGGVFVVGGGINVINTTVSGNVAAGRGGGIAMAQDTCTGFCEVGLYNATVANNTAASASDGVYIAPGLQLRAQNSIIANNNDADCEGTIQSGGYNLIENTAGCSFLGLAIYDVLGVDPKLGRLALNGGPTLNHLPGRDSPAINAGNPGGCSSPAGATLITDQRGLPRTAGRRCDIGAVEVQPEAAPEWLVFLPIVMR